MDKRRVGLLKWGGFFSFRRKRSHRAHGGGHWRFVIFHLCAEAERFGVAEAENLGVRSTTDGNEVMREDGSETSGVVGRQQWVEKADVRAGCLNSLPVACV